MFLLLKNFVRTCVSRDTDREKVINGVLDASIINIKLHQQIFAILIYFFDLQFQSMKIRQKGHNYPRNEKKVSNI